MGPKPTKGEYIETETGNKVSRRANILGTPHIILGGKSVIQADCTIRGDLRRLPTSSPTNNPTTTTTATPAKPTSTTSISIGRYCIFASGSLLRPPARLQHHVLTYYPQKIGDHVFVGPGAVVEAAVIGNHVRIGRGAVVGKFAILKDCVKVLDGAVVPAAMVVPSFSVVAGRPARVVGELEEGWGAEGGGGELREWYRRI
ncbi:MAG: hypothetical protein M1817_004133 [Caeruleum heppii]|nr:MAG: hypothetical protein M1817_004133 [Caeruleum heppii]